jgi:hypothetical protein
MLRIINKGRIIVAANLVVVIISVIGIAFSHGKML